MFCMPRLAFTDDAFGESYAGRLDLDLTFGPAFGFKGQGRPCGEGMAVPVSGERNFV